VNALVPFTLDITDQATGAAVLKPVAYFADNSSAPLDCHKPYELNVQPVDCAGVQGDV
jgi:hypothetical protein